ncbi:aminotransferase class I/II-fold pyridoxal phosphate-dependent enzyme [Gryllotalpicola sp.]|uniref:aminotransferase class I/II-fold pyridoxal phosphate-dependent enzyme n=1 Tax=Gryllotalpicola sp. TaxID=1932787 RepID=UPI002619CE3F|nr:aminotransferase class I/II-fold pyridoxal phosphate-dependent enzyme [Gryllotalpicola sp.]
MTDLAEIIDDATPQGIAAEIARQITAGTLEPGERLPTVRALAAALGVSPATVSHAWQALSGAGMIVSRGRAGSFVRQQSSNWLPRSMQQLAGYGGPSAIDLSRGTPDPALLPSLDATIARMPQHADTDSYQLPPVIPELDALLRESWPVAPEALTVVDGALDALSRLLDEIARFGDRIAVESPGFPPLFDLLDVHGIERVPLELDENGVLPASLSAALSRGLSAIVIQPRAHNPTGASLTAERAEALAAVIRAHRNGARLVVIEDDHSGLISIAADVTLATWLPGQVVHVRSFSKSHGPDLRIAAVGGPRPIVERLIARRILGPGWTSRLLQTILYDLLTDPDSIAQVARARDLYAERQRALREALAEHGVRIAPADGINAWLPVTDERDAVVKLAAAGIRVAAGAAFHLGGGPAAVRLSVGGAALDASHIAALADVAER